jgi:hypothetical protein
LGEAGKAALADFIADLDDNIARRPAAIEQARVAFHWKDGSDDIFAAVVAANGADGATGETLQ